MRKLLLCALALISVISCGPKKQKSANLSLNNFSKEALTTLSDPERKKTETVKPDLVYPEQSLFTTEGRYLFFGKLGYRDRSFQEDTLLFPPIEGLVHGSAYALCPKDTCFAEYAVLALRCPPIQPLLNWVADTVNTFIQECPIGNGLLTYNDKQLDIPVKYLKSDKAICDYYIGQLQHTYDDWHCTGEGDHDILNEQAGLLLADCWHTGNLYTFYRIDWYDWMSGGNNARESWWTVDATSGKLLSLSDFILPDKLDTLAALMTPRLINDKDSFILDQYPYKPEEYTDILQCANGCALIPEGLVFYFYPYNLGSGADGQFEAVIPYEELNRILRPSILNSIMDSVETYDGLDDKWDASVKGHVRPGSIENNEITEMVTGIWWNKKKGKGKVEIVPALKQVDNSSQYVDIHTNELWEQPYEDYGDCMWYLQIDCWYKVVVPLYLNYYSAPKFVYEGDLDQDGVPEFGILLKRRKSNCCSYALLSIKDRHWVLKTEPFTVAYNLRASGKELARKGDKKGEIKITKSGFDDDGLSTCMDAQIVDTVIVAKTIDIGDIL